MGGIFLAVIIAGAVYLEYQKNKSAPKIDGQFDEVGSQIKMGTPFDGAKEIYNGLVDRFFAPLPIAPIDLDSVPSDSAVSSPVLESTPSTAPKITLKPSGGTTTDGSCFSSAAFQKVLADYEEKLTAYEQAFKAYEAIKSAYVPNSGQSHPSFTKEFQSAMSAYSSSLTTYDELISASEDASLKCAPPAVEKIKLCISDYEKIECVNMPLLENGSCYVQESRIAANSCFR